MEPRAINTTFKRSAQIIARQPANLNWALDQFAENPPRAEKIAFSKDSLRFAD
jgi:hypothetical protein